MGGIAVIGRGAMGRPIAHNLVKAGHDVVVWNRSDGPADEPVADGRGADDWAVVAEQQPRAAADDR